MSSPTYGPGPDDPGRDAPQAQPGWAPPPSSGGYGGPQAQPGWAPPPPQGGWGSPAQGGYGAPPADPGGPGAGRPGTVTAAGVTGIAIGAIVALVNVLGLAVAGDALVEVTALDVLLSVLAIAAGAALVVGGIRVVRDAGPDLLLYAAYGLAAVWLINVVVVFSRGGGFAGAGLLLIVGAAVISTLLRSRSAQQWYGTRTGA